MAQVIQNVATTTSSKAFDEGWQESYANDETQWGTEEDPTEEKIVEFFQKFRRASISGSIDEDEAMYLAGVVTGWFERAWSR